MNTFNAVRWTIAVTASAAAFPVDIAEAQEVDARPGLIVLSQNICPFDNVPRLRAMVDSLFAPVLDQLVQDGKLVDWALLSNWWGDDWNWSLTYTAESHEAFLEFWNLYVNQLGARRPGWSDEVVALCTEHRDMFYTVIRTGRPRLPTLPAAPDSSSQK